MACSHIHCAIPESWGLFDNASKSPDSYRYSCNLPLPSSDFVGLVGFTLVVIQGNDCGPASFKLCLRSFIIAVFADMAMFGWDLFLIRDKDGNINAFHNICRHRGYPVVTKDSGSSTVLACRFHGW